MYLTLVFIHIQQQNYVHFFLIDSEILIYKIHELFHIIIYI